MRRSKPLASTLAAVFLVALHSNASTVFFGTGNSGFTMDFVRIGNPGNAPDTGGTPNPAGGVDYVFSMGTYEVSRAMIEVGNAQGGLGISLRDMSPFDRGSSAESPATGISWFEAAHFVNWMNTSQGFSEAYSFDSSGNFQLWTTASSGYDPANPFRNSEARFVLPSVDEWYKAAYYDPETGQYHDYATGSDSGPDSVMFGSSPGTAVFSLDLVAGPADIMNAGGLSAFGTMGQSGNVSEWEETAFDLVNDDATRAELRGQRGGFWNGPSSQLRGDFRARPFPDVEASVSGFRVAMIPEPSAKILTLFGLVTLLTSRRSRGSQPES